MARFWQTPAVILYNAPDKHFVTTAVSVLKGCWFYPYCFFRCFFFQWQVYSNVWLFYIKRWVMWMNYELHIVFFSFFFFFFFYRSCVSVCETDWYCRNNKTHNVTLTQAEDWNYTPPGFETTVSGMNFPKQPFQQQQQSLTSSIVCA